MNQSIVTACHQSRQDLESDGHDDLRLGRHEASNYLHHTVLARPLPLKTGVFGRR